MSQYRLEGDAQDSQSPRAARLRLANACFLFGALDQPQGSREPLPTRAMAHGACRPTPLSYKRA